MPPPSPAPARVAVHADGRVAVDRPPGADRLLLPPMVNAHAHLELHRIGPQPYDAEAGFVGWVEMLRSHWPGEGDPMTRRRDPDWLTDAARAAAKASRDQGVGYVGDIAHGPAAADATREAGVAGVTFVELFGHADPPEELTQSLIDAVAAADRPDLGLQPHAPYSTGSAVFTAATRVGCPVATHLAEMPDELRFVAEGQGPFRDLLVRIGKWRAEIADGYRDGQTPVAWLASRLRARPWLLAHGNYLTDADIDLLAALPDSARASIAYCPIASEYFGHEGHRYRDLLAAGVNVCLGTDSIACQPPDAPQPYALVAQMRRLFRRDGVDPETLMRMATVNGAQALGLHGLDFTTSYASVAIDPDHPTDPLVQLLRDDAPIRPR